MDQRVVERAQRGDHDAFAVLATSSMDRLFRVAYRILRDVEAARDATQQAMLEAWRGLPGLREPGNWEAWTYRLVVRACYQHVRRDRRMAAVVQLIPIERDTDPDVAGAIADRDELDRAFRRLPIEQRAVVVLHYHLDLPLTEVAQILDIPAGTARSRLHNATRRLRAAVEADAGRPASREGRSA